MARGCGPTLRGKSAKIQTQNWVSNCAPHILPPLSSVSAAESQSLSIETGLQPKRIRGEGREPEKELTKKDSSLLLLAIRSLSIGGSLKKTRLYSGFKNIDNKVSETRKLESIRE
jgi:hypothetical protein